MACVLRNGQRHGMNLAQRKATPARNTRGRATAVHNTGAPRPAPPVIGHDAKPLCRHCVAVSATINTSREIVIVRATGREGAVGPHAMADNAKAIAATTAEPLIERGRMSLSSRIGGHGSVEDVQKRASISSTRGKSWACAKGHNRQAGELEFPVDLVCSSLRPPLVLLNRLYLLPPPVAAPIEDDVMPAR